MNSKKVKISLEREGVSEKDLLKSLNEKASFMEYKIIFKQHKINHIQLLVTRKEFVGFIGIFHISLNDGCLYNFTCSDIYTINLIHETLEELC